MEKSKNAPIQKNLKLLLIFSLIVFFISTHDGIVSYASPVLLNKYLKDEFIFGIVLSTSSFFGMLMNYYIAKKLPKKRYSFFLDWMFITAFIFPLIIIFLPKEIMFFILAMFAWSVYYEARNYSKYDFVKSHLTKDQHTFSWSVFQIAQGTGYLIGPIFAVYFLNIGLEVPFYATYLFIFLALICYFWLKKHKRINIQTDAKPLQNGNCEDAHEQHRNEWKIIKILLKKLGSYVYFVFAITLLDVAVWTIGILYAEELRQTHHLGGLFIVLYNIPGIFVGFIVPKLKLKIGKKRASFITGILAGGLFIFMGINTNIYIVLLSILLTSIFYGVTNILVSAVFEDYVARAEVAGKELIGLNQFALNAAYTAGPILIGLSTKILGFSSTFALVGFFIVLVSTVAALSTPRKIRIPQKEVRGEIVSNLY
jgi:predicted MFS family arabinose efflux permease